MSEANTVKSVGTNPHDVKLMVTLRPNPNQTLSVPVKIANVTSNSVKQTTIIIISAGNFSVV